MKKGKVINFVDLFSGGGGLSCGLEMAGLRCLLGVDFDKASMETFKRNHKSAESYLGDIKDLTVEDIKRLVKGKKIHLIVGGPPCQGFSTVGEGIPDDPRNFLFMHFVRLVREIKPEYVIVENVTGLVGKKNEKVLRGILKEFNSIGYAMSVKVLSAQDYGVPQKRRRTIFIGNRIGIKNIFPEPTNGIGMKKISTVGDALKSLMSKDGKIYNHCVEKVFPKSEVEIERISHIPEGGGIRYEEDEKKYLPKNLWLGIDWKNMAEGRLRQKRYHRLSRKDPSPTIMTGRHSYFHPTENRYLTPREAAAIQSFPNWFVFEGTISQQWRQIGNAVPPLLGEALGKSVIEMDTKRPPADKNPINFDGIRKAAFVYKKSDEGQKTLRTLF